MRIQGQILNALNDSGLPGVLVSMQTLWNGRLPVGKTNANGDFSVNVPGTGAGNLVFTHPDFYPRSVDIGTLQAAGPITLAAKSRAAIGIAADSFMNANAAALFTTDQGLPQAGDSSYRLSTMQAVETIAPQNQVQPVQPAANNYLPLVLAAGGLLLLTIPGKKKRKVGAAEKRKFDWTSLIVPAITIGGGAYLVYKLGGILGPSAGNSANNSNVDAAVKNNNQGALADLAHQGILPTLTQAKMTSLANDIWNQAGTNQFGPLASDAGQVQIVRDLVAVRNLADVYGLKLAFGTREGASSMWSTCSLLGFNCQALDLDTVVNLALRPQYVQQVNDFLGYAGINYSY